MLSTHDLAQVTMIANYAAAHTQSVQTKGELDVLEGWLAFGGLFNLVSGGALAIHLLWHRLRAQRREREVLEGIQV